MRSKSASTSGFFEGALTARHPHPFSLRENDLPTSGKVMGSAHGD
jgi:hypothetical protein